MQRILVVDDDPLVSSLICRMLSTVGYDVTVACNGLDALEKLDRARPDLILSDMQMPEMDGETFFRALRARGSEVPFVGMSGNPDTMLVSDFDACLTKPFQMKDLLHAVERTVARHPVG